LTIDVNNRYFRIKHPKWGGQTLYQLYEKAHTPWKWFKKLKKVTENEGMVFFSTAYDKTAVDFLEELEVPVHKIASFELVDLPLIEYMAKMKKPIILSVGMASSSEIKEAVNAARKTGAKEITLLKCVSDYPAEPEEMNLKTIPHMKKTFKCRVGLSDHTLGIGTSIAACMLGASMVEKHFTLSRKIKTPDSFFSIEPRELEQMVNGIRFAEKSLGKIHYGPTKKEKKNLAFRRSLFTVKGIAKGEIFTDKNIKSIRPADGMAPKYIKNIFGKKARKGIKKGTPLRRDLIGGAK